MFLSNRTVEAFKLAHELHQHQMRKDTGIPYLSHLMAVAALVAEYGGSEEQIIAALLHDAVEDQGGAATLARIRGAFGDTVARIVAGCTDTDQDPKPPWRERKEAYVAALPRKSGAIKLVSAADKIHNMRAIVRDVRLGGPAVWDRFNGKRDGTLWYHGALYDAFRTGWDHPILIEFAEVLDALRTAGNEATERT